MDAIRYVTPAAVIINLLCFFPISIACCVYLSVELKKICFFVYWFLLCQITFHVYNIVPWVQEGLKCSIYLIVVSTFLHSYNSCLHLFITRNEMSTSTNPVAPRSTEYIYIYHQQHHTL